MRFFVHFDVSIQPMNRHANPTPDAAHSIAPAGYSLWRAGAGMPAGSIGFDVLK